MKHGRPIDSKNKNPRKKKEINDQDDHGLKEISQDETQVITNDELSKEVQTSKNNEISWIMSWRESCGTEIMLWLITYLPIMFRLT